MIGRICTVPTIVRPVRSASIDWLCCAWPVQRLKTCVCGGVGDGCDATDKQMARGYLSERYSEAELDQQLTRMRCLAHRLVSDYFEDETGRRRHGRAERRTGLRGG
jgi:hypothetical protein